MLRAAKALTLSLVAEEDGQVLGHIGFSPVLIDGAEKGWYGLGPVSVLPARQGEGIGGKLIREGLRNCAVPGQGVVFFLASPAIMDALVSRPMRG